MPDTVKKGYIPSSLHIKQRSPCGERCKDLCLSHQAGEVSRTRDHGNDHKCGNSQGDNTKDEAGGSKTGRLTKRGGRHGSALHTKDDAEDRHDQTGKGTDPEKRDQAKNAQNKCCDRESLTGVTASACRLEAERLLAVGLLTVGLLAERLLTVRLLAVRLLTIGLLTVGLLAVRLLTVGLLRLAKRLLRLLGLRLTKEDLLRLSLLRLLRLRRLLGLLRLAKEVLLILLIGIEIHNDTPLRKFCWFQHHQYSTKILHSQYIL